LSILKNYGYKGKLIFEKEIDINSAGRRVLRIAKESIMNADENRNLIYKKSCLK